jgi:hypothetical protein
MEALQERSETLTLSLRLEVQTRKTLATKRGVRKSLSIQRVKETDVRSVVLGGTRQGRTVAKVDFKDENSRDKYITKSKIFVANGIWAIEAFKTGDETTKVEFHRVPAYVTRQNLSQLCENVPLVDSGQATHRNTVGRTPGLSWKMASAIAMLNSTRRGDVKETH